MICITIKPMQFGQSGKKIEIIKRIKVFASWSTQQKMCLLEDVRDSIEYPYRKGRVAHEMGEADAALQWYDETITLGWDSHYYFAANAALKAGNICESELRYDRAEYYYRKCLNMPNREYRRSLQQKAKAGLNRIRDKKKAD